MMTKISLIVERNKSLSISKISRSSVEGLLVDNIPHFQKTHKCIVVGDLKNASVYQKVKNGKIKIGFIHDSMFFTTPSAEETQHLMNGDIDPNTVPPL